MRWFDRNLTPMKIGTVPHVVLVHGADAKRMNPGVYVRIKESEGDKWHTVLVREVRDGEQVFADRM